MQTDTDDIIDNSGPDFHAQNHGSVWRVTPLAEYARKHLAEGVGEDAQWFGGSLVVEPRYIEHLVQGLESNGYSVKLFI